MERDGARKPSVISPSGRKKSQFRTNYFIGRCLLNNGDKRASKYFWMCVSGFPLSARAWLNFLLSKLIWRSESSSNSGKDETDKHRFSA